MNKLDISSLRRRVLVRHHPSAFLLAAQLASLLLYAAFDGIHSGRAWLGALSVLILALAVWVVNRSPAINWIAWVIAAPAFVLSLLSALFVDTPLLAWSSLLEAALYFYTAGSLIAYMMQDYRVTTDELFAAGAPSPCLPGDSLMSIWSARCGTRAVSPARPGRRNHGRSSSCYS